MKFKSIHIWLFFLLMTFSLQGCAQDRMVGDSAYGVLLHQLLDHTVPEITVDQAVQWEEKATFLDARERPEFQISHIAGAEYVGYDKFDLTNLSDVSKEDTLVVYCSVGYRSEKVSKMLIEDGYENVFNLYGGIFEWKNKGEPVVDTTGKTTEKVHAFDRTWGIWLKKGQKVYD